AAITIENSGSNPLTVTGATLAGANAGDFGHDIVTGSVAATSNNAYTLTYTASTTGSTFASIAIGSNDSDENPYTIYIEGVGTDNLATEPAANPSALTFPVIEAYAVGGQYTAGSGATNYLVLWKNGSAMTATPADGMSYLRGDIVGDARVAYVGAGTSFTPRGIIANQDYYFAVYAFNGSGGFENYLLTTPLEGNTSSLGEGIASYYTGIDKTAGTFVSDLNGLINPHTEVSYFLYKQTVMNEFEIKDTIGGQSYVTCAMSGEKLIINDPFDWSDAGYSREHTFSHSWMHTFPADTPEEPEYNDQHNLYPANLVQANIPRSNLPMDDIDSTVVFSYLGGSVGYANGQLAYEPRASHKGNAARAVMYMAVTYNFNLDGNVNSTKQSQEVLKDWHFADLPDNYEIARHEYIFNLQGNRNPFIDSTDYACYIDFDALAHVPTGCIVGIGEEYLDANLVVFPVPSNDVVYVQVNGTEITSYSVLDLNGRVVESASGKNLQVLTLHKENLGAGTYLINVETPLGQVQRKMIIQ
ncbi:MAG: endonuclease, partial [Crocinitomicaceae bacterium]|nr:endonuclease [Crocinitomicaceae bacterium]